MEEIDCVKLCLFTKETERGCAATEIRNPHIRLFTTNGVKSNGALLVRNLPYDLPGQNHLTMKKKSLCSFCT